MKIIYLAAYKAHHPNYDVTYQDINGLRDIGGDMMDVDLEPYDIIIATPPCNYYSKINRSRETSQYSQMTKHLLPSIIQKLNNQDKPYIIENVRSHIINELIKNLKSFHGFIYQHGRHTYWTNIPFSPEGIKQHFEFMRVGPRGKGGTAVKLNKNVQGGFNVHDVVEYWLKVVTS